MFGRIVCRLICSVALAAFCANAEPLLESVFLQDLPFNGKGNHFGGFSALHITPDGVNFIALSDQGAFVAGRFLRDTTGRIQSIETGTVTRLRGKDSNPLGQGLTDSEGLALAADGSTYISFEGPALIRHYASLNGPGEVLPLHPAFSKLGQNRALEALAISHSGVLYAIPEESTAPTQPFPVYRFRSGRWDQPYTIPRRGPFLLSDATFGPDGRLYVLEREFLGLAGFATRLRRFDLTSKRPINEQTLLVTQPGTFGNLEGLAVWRDAEGLRATMVSDDNFKLFLRSQIVEYRLPD